LRPTLEALRSDGYARLSAAELRAALAPLPGALEALAPSWNDLPQDIYLRDGGRYRFRRHTCFVQDLEAGTLERAPHRAHWQPTTYNALHGGLERWFEPIELEVTESGAWRRLLVGFGEVFAALRSVPRWYIEAHQFRIDTVTGIGRPTPEGAHRDGVDYIAIVLVDRVRVLGGETRVFAVDSRHGVRFTLAEPWSALLLDDARVVHETTPIQSEGSQSGWRDTLVLTYRAAGFQAP
jgi:hypothetical protein